MITGASFPVDGIAVRVGAAVTDAVGELADAAAGVAVAGFVAVGGCVADGDGVEVAAHVGVLDGAEMGDAVAAGAGELVAVDVGGTLVLVACASWASARAVAVGEPAVGVRESATRVGVSIDCSGAGSASASQPPSTKPARTPREIIAIFDRASALTGTILRRMPVDRHS